MPLVSAAARKAYQKAYNARYAAANPDKERARQARYAAANPDKVKARDARYRAEHPEKGRAKSARYRAENPEMGRAHTAKRRARKLAAGGRGITARQWNDVLSSTLGLCTYCNERRPLALDHVVPLSAGGEHDIENAVPACGPCNSSKGKAPLLLWLARRAA